MSTYYDETTTTTARPLPNSNAFVQTTPKVTFADKTLHGVSFRDLLKSTFDNDDGEDYDTDDK